MKLRSEFSYDADLVSFETGLQCDDLSLAQQHFKEECDINTIMERFGQTGQLPDVRMPQYGDFTGVQDYHSAMNAVVEAQESFMALPAHVRARFDNDPGQFVDFCLAEDTPEHRAEAVRLGLVSPSPTPVGGAAEAAAQSST